MRAVILQHNIYEGPGYILSWLHAQGFTTDIFFLYKLDTPPPNILSANLLIILNGSISVYNEHIHPWIKVEKKIVRQAIENNIPTLGICFGAQLIASIYGAKIFASSEQKIGWFPINTKPKKTTKHFLFPDNLKILLWHKDEFEVPKNAIQIASSSICTNQAFQIKNNVIGVQFHPHMTPYLLQYMINNNPLNIATNQPDIQKSQQLASISACFFEQNNQLINDIISYLLTKNKKTIY